MSANVSLLNSANSIQRLIQESLGRVHSPERSYSFHKNSLGGQIRPAPSADRHGCKGREDWRRDHLESPQSHHGVPQTGYPVDALPTGATGSGNIAHAQQSGLRSDRARIPVTLREHKTSQQQSTALRKITIHPSA